MLLIVLALFWIALLAPIAVRRLRDGGTEKSIQSFHTEHEVLSRQDYTVAPAHRLDQPDQPVHDRGGERRPRLTVVHADDTFGTLESRSSWDEWSDDYDYDPPSSHAHEKNHYARAYSSRPNEPEVTARYEAPLRRRSMKAQRRIIFSRMVLLAVVLTAIAFFSGYSLVVDVAALSWFLVIAFVALALFSVSQGYLSGESIPLRLPQRRPLATVKPLYSAERESASRYDEDFESEFYEPGPEEWRREEEPRRALG